MKKCSTDKCSTDKCSGKFKEQYSCNDGCGCSSGTCINKTNGNMARSEGSNSIASGFASHAEGQNTKACGSKSHSEGYKTKASGEDSHAEGHITMACGYASHSEGISTKSSGAAAHTEGSNTEASGHMSHAEGLGTKAKGMKSHSEGGCTTATGDASHSEGLETESEGLASHSEGFKTQAIGKYTHSGGHEAYAPQYAQWARSSGCFNIIGDAQSSIFHIRGTGSHKKDAILALHIDNLNEDCPYKFPIIPKGMTWSFVLIISGISIIADCTPVIDKHVSYAAHVYGLAQRDSCDKVVIQHKKIYPLSTGLHGDPVFMTDIAIKGSFILSIESLNTLSNWYGTLIVSQVGTF